MSYKLPVILGILLLVSCCTRKEVLDPELQTFHDESFFWVEYKVNGELFEYAQPRENHVLEQFEGPVFDFYNKGGEDLVATFRFKWDDDFYFGLHSTQGYFTNARKYKLNTALPLRDTIVLKDGCRLLSGTFSLNVDRIYYNASYPYSYDSFFVCFEGTAEKPGSGFVNIDGGRLTFQRNVVEKMKADDFRWFLYKYDGQ